MKGSYHDLILDRPWGLSPVVALRSERFGALAYHFGNRRLTFLKRHELVPVLRALDECPDMRTALVNAGVPAGQWARYVDALKGLASADMIRPRTPTRNPMTSVENEPITPSRTHTTSGSLVDEFERGLDAPICLTWEMTYGCNLSCVHCLSSSGRRDPRELTTDQCEALIDELQAMQVFYVNIGGGEPTLRGDFWHLLDYAVDHRVGVKFSTNGVRITQERAKFLASSDYIDVQVSLDGATAEVNDPVRGPGSYEMAIRALDNLSEAGSKDAKISVVVTRHNVGQLDEYKKIADDHGATLRLTRLRPSGRGVSLWDKLRPTPTQQRELHRWLLHAGETVLTGDSFFHLAGYGEALPGLNLCGAGRVVCLIDPIGDVYACPFATHDDFHAGNILSEGGFALVWSTSELFSELRSPKKSGACTRCQFFDSCRGGCMAAKFFTGLSLDGPDPECVLGHGEQALAETRRSIRKPRHDHSHRAVPAQSQRVLLQVSQPTSTAPSLRVCAAGTLVAELNGTEAATTEGLQQTPHGQLP